MNKLVKKLQNAEIKNYLKSNQIKHIWLVWSHAKWLEKPWSDIDLLYEYNPEQKRKSWWIFSVKAFLDEKLKTNCDLIDKDHIHELIKEDILSSKVEVW